MKRERGVRGVPRDGEGCRRSAKEREAVRRAAGVAARLLVPVAGLGEHSGAEGAERELRHVDRDHHKRKIGAVSTRQNKAVRART
eukprot:5281627-Pleurochrysis_carterae.AAC.3